MAFDFDSVSGEKVGSSKDRRGLKYDRSERGRLGHQSAPTSRGLRGDYGLVSPRVPEAKPSKRPLQGCWGGLPRTLFSRYHCIT